MWALLRLCLLPALITPCLSNILYNSISLSTDNRPSIPFSRPFELFPGSDFHFVALGVSDGEIAWAPGTPENQKSLDCFKFVLEFNSDALLHMDEDVVDDICAPEAEMHWSQLLGSLNSATFHNPDNNSVHIDHFGIMDRGALKVDAMFTPFFVNCCSNMSTVTLEGEIIMYQNVYGNMSLAAIGEFALPWIYRVMGVVYVVGLLMWAQAMKHHPGSIYPIHALLLTLAVSKAATLILESMVYFSLNRVGSADGWHVAYCIATFIEGSLFYLTYLLVASGRSHMKPFVNRYQVKALMVLLPFQVVVEVASAVASGVSPAGPIYAICWRFASFVDSVLYNPLGISIMAAMFGICFGVDRKLMRRANGVDDGKTPWKRLEPLVIFMLLLILFRLMPPWFFIVPFPFPANIKFFVAAGPELPALAMYALAAAHFWPRQRDLPATSASEPSLEANTNGSPTAATSMLLS